MPTQALLAVAFFEASAICILLVLYLLLERGFRQRFFRLWVAGWVLFAGYGASRLVDASLGRPGAGLTGEWLYFAASVLLVLSVLEYLGRSARGVQFLALAAVGFTALVLQAFPATRAAAWNWALAICESLLYLWVGWLLWRFSLRQKGHGTALLAAALLLRSLHGFDRADWSTQPIYLLRASFNSLLEVTLGIGMAVLVLEAGRLRMEDLHEKLRRLTMVTAATTQSMQVDEALRRVLKHLVESTRLSHGLVSLLDESSSELVLRTSVGFGAGFLERYGRVPAKEPLVRSVLAQEAPLVGYEDTLDPGLRKWMQAGELSALVLLRLPGKKNPLGLLGVGSAAPRRFADDEADFLVNMANLLGLTIQNVQLFEEVARAGRQWSYTFDSITDPILVHDREFRVLRANRMLAERIGRDPAMLPGRPLSELLRRDSTSWVNCPYCESAAGKADRPDPTFGGYFLVMNSDFHGPEGAKLGTIHVMRDITEHKEVEEKYRSLFASVQEGVFISTPDGRFIDFNETLQRMLGYENREELMKVEIGTDLCVNPKDRDRLKRLLREHGAVSNFEFEMLRKDGEILVVSESSVATRDASGAVTAHQGFLLDVTERHRAELELRRRNRDLMVLNAIAQTLSEAVELDQVLARALRQTVEMFGMDTGGIYLFEEKASALRRVAAVGHRTEAGWNFPVTALPPELIRQIRELRPTLISPMSLRLPSFFAEHQQREGIVQAQGVVLWSKDRILGLLVISSRTAKEFGQAELNLLATVGSQFAATIDKAMLLEETREAYENLRRTQEQLLQSEKMAAVGQLISGVAHELNNPLTAVLGYSQLLASSEHVTANGAEFVEKLYRQAQRTHRIVQNLLAFARPHRPERVPLRLNQIVEDTLSLREYDLKLNDIQVHRELAPDLPVTSGDFHQLQQVFLNILNNAVDAIQEVSTRGEIWVCTASAGGRVLLECIDSGPGLREPLRVFDPFYTTKPVGKGTGLGLSICYGIVKEHGGEIEAKNVPPRGASFRVWLPVVSAGEKPADPRRPDADTCVCGRILLVDDEPAVLELEQEILRGRCQGVLAARGGREAIEILSRERVELVVTDMKMPGEVSGRDIYYWIERNRPELSSRVIFTLSNDPGEDFAEWLRSCRCAHVQKPFTVEEFLRAIRRVFAPVNSPAGQPAD